MVGGSFFFKKELKRCQIRQISCQNERVFVFLFTLGFESLLTAGLKQIFRVFQISCFCDVDWLG